MLLAEGKQKRYSPVRLQIFRNFFAVSPSQRSQRVQAMKDVIHYTGRLLNTAEASGLSDSDSTSTFATHDDFDESEKRRMLSLSVPLKGDLMSLNVAFFFHYSLLHDINHDFLYLLLLQTHQSHTLRSIHFVDTPCVCDL